MRSTRSKSSEAPRHSFGLATLLGVRSSEAFLRRAWPESLFVHHAGLRRFPELLAIPAFANAAAFVAAWKGAAHAWPPSGKRGAIACRTGEAVRTAYESGWTVYCTQVEKRWPELEPLARRLEEDLGLRHGDITCQVIATKRGHVGQPHFDADCTFNLQLAGEKRWRVARNDSVAYPHVTGRIGDPMPPGIAEYATRAFPRSMPSDGKRFTTRAGSLVYLPHGCWHATICENDSLSLLFVLTGPKWFELFSGEIRRVLAMLPEARKISLLGRGCDVRSARRVLERLRWLVARMDAVALLERWTARPPTRFRKPHGAPVLVTGQNERLRSMLRWLSRAPSTFDAHDVVEAFRGEAASEVEKDLAVLVRLGVIEIVPARPSPIERSAGRRRRRNPRREAGCRSSA